MLSDLQLTETPISLPMPNVTAAAARPNNTCLNPEYHTFFPVNNVIAAPIRNNPAALIETLIRMAFIPFVNMNGMTGITAPIEKRIKEYTAASTAEPFSSSAFIPSSSLTSISCARFLSFIISDDI